MELYNINLNFLVESENNFGVVLITSYYESANTIRNREINDCLINNCNNKFIKKIYLLNDKIYNLDFLPSQDKIVQVLTNNPENQLSFDFAISFTNTHLKDEICILANSDIYYDNTLVLLKNYNLNKKVIALSRYESSTGKLWKNAISSQDTWIYKSPVSVDIAKCNFNFGVPACDHLIGSLFNEQNLVFNPCLDLKSYHLHDSMYRTYTHSQKLSGNYFFVIPSHLNLQDLFLNSLDKFIDNDGFCVMTFINEGYFDFLHNYIINLKKINIHWKLLVVCVDKGASRLCTKNNIDHVLYNIGTVTTKSIFGTPNFRKIAIKKIDCISLVLKNLNIKKLIYTDTDITVYKDFIPYLKSLENDKDIYFQADSNNLVTTTHNTNRCSGFMFMKNSDAIHELFNNNEIYDILIPHDNSTDQRYINNKLHLVDNITVGQLPRHLFPNGVLANNDLPDKFIFHYNFMKGDDKIKKMKLHERWFLETHPDVLV